MKFVTFLKQSGYRLFRGAVDARVYEFFQCPKPQRALWYHKEGSYQCAGCKIQCETDSPVGFQTFLDLD
jgi:hypothetical protein